MTQCDVQITQIGGNCPVQAEGTVNGKPFYFRARGGCWSMSIAESEDGDPLDSDAWVRREDYGDGPFDAGWMPVEEAEAFIRTTDRWYVDSLEKTP